jgi:hypothetical protein
MPYKFILDSNYEPLQYLTDFNETVWRLLQTSKIHFCQISLMIYNIASPSTEQLLTKYKQMVYKSIQKKFKIIQCNYSL